MRLLKQWCKPPFYKSRVVADLLKLGEVHPECRQLGHYPSKILLGVYERWDQALTELAVSDSEIICHGSCLRGATQGAHLFCGCKGIDQGGDGTSKPAEQRYLFQGRRSADEFLMRVRSQFLVLLGGQALLLREAL